MQGSNISVWLRQLLEKLNPDQIQQAACTLWVIWNGRNNEVYGDPRINAQFAANFVKLYMEEFNSALSKKVENHSQWKQPQHWRPLGNGRYKLNFDGAVD